KSEADKLPSLTTVPVIAGRVFVQCAVRVYGFGALPEPDFARLWTSDITLPFFTSAAAEAFDEVTSNIVLVYAAAQLLGERSLLPVENDFLTAQRDKAEAAFKRLQELLNAVPPDVAVEVLAFLPAFNATCLGDQDKATQEKAAVQIARQ